MLPPEIINKIFTYMESPTNKIIKKLIKYYTPLYTFLSFQRYCFMLIKYHITKIWYITEKDFNYENYEEV